MLKDIKTSLWSFLQSKISHYHLSEIAANFSQITPNKFALLHFYKSRGFTPYQFATHFYIVKLIMEL